MTTSNASSALPPCAVGSVSGPMTLSCSIIDRLPIGPPRGGDAPAEIGDDLRGNVHLEGANCVVVGRRSKLTWQEADGSRGCRCGQNVSAGWQSCRHGILL